ncbi:FlgD Flagellar hook capping protein [Caulobacteraceae bacterium]|jgi:flagellar basal-body rod modification protein FlgD
MTSTIDPTATAAGASINEKLNSSRNRLASSEETFLALLTTQLKNQDPLSPLDSNEFTAQIVQMTGVEQQLMTNDLLKMLVGMSDGGLSGSVNLIGKAVTAETSQAVIADGAATWTYDLDRNAASVKYEIVNSAGSTVWSRTDASVAAGEKSLDWNGVTAAGNQLANGGAYTLKITATGSGGETIAAKPRASGIVTGVQTIDGETVVSIGKLKVPVSSITGVQSAS